MQMQNNTVASRNGTPSFFDPLDFPTEEELWAALEASLEQSPWLPRPVPAALDATSRNLAQRWQEIAAGRKEVALPDDDDHYLSPWANEQSLNDEVEPELLIDLTKFLLERLTGRMQDIRQAQQQLAAELAKLRR
jgi:hypothetical protein